MPRSPGGRLDPGRIVGARVDWSGASRARATRLAARSSFFGIGIVGSFGSYRQPQFFPLQASDTLGSTTVLDSFTDASAPRDLPTYNPAWSAPAFGGELTPKTTPAGTVTGVAGGTSGAYYPAVSQADVRVFATVAARPADGNVFELLARLQNPGGAQNCYALVAFANAGTDSIELYQFTAGAGTFLGVFQAADYSAGDTFALDITGVSPFTVATAYKNGLQIGTVANLSFVSGAGSVGVRLQDTVGALDDFGIGSGVSDVATRALALPRTTGDTLATSDDATRAATTRARTATDALGTSDAAIRAPLSRTASDALGTSDAAARAPLAQSRTASDALGTSDAAARAPVTRPRTAVDGLGSSYPTAVLADSPQLYWRLGETAGTTAADASGNGHTGTYGSAVALGAAGLLANDADTSVQMTNAVNQEVVSSYTPFVNGGSITVEGVSQLTYPGPVHNAYLWRGTKVSGAQVPGARPYVAVNPTDGRVSFGAAGSGPGMGGAWPLTGQPVHWALTFNEATDTAELFIDGVSQGTLSEADPYSTPGFFQVNDSSGGDGNYIQGRTDEVAVYSYLVAASRIAAHSRAAKTGGAGTSDAATRTLAQARSAADTLGTSDAATRAPLAQPRTASDALYNTYDPVIDVDSPTSHWKLGETATAVDRKGVTNLPAVGGGLAVVPGITANAGPSLANEAVGTAGARFFNSGSAGTPYEGPYTMEAWVKPTADVNGLILERSGGTYLGLNQDGRGTLVSADFSFENSAGAQTRRVSTLNVGSIYHLAITHDGSTVVMYVNGAEVNRVTGVSGNRVLATAVPAIVNSSGGPWPRAVIDEVAWYSGALSAARVLAHYQAGTGAPAIDFATRAVLLPRVAADSLGTSDAAVATTSGVPSRTASDSLGTSDAATRAAVVRTRTASDSVGTSDAATRTLTLARTASDAATSSGGYAVAQRDDFTSDTRANWTVLSGGGSSATWGGSTWSFSSGTFGYIAVPLSWGNASDVDRVRILGRANGGGFSCGFVQPGSLAFGSSVSAQLQSDGTIKTFYDGGTSSSETTSSTVAGVVANTYYLLEFTRNGNSYTVTVYDATGTSVLFTQTKTFTGARATAYGAGVPLRPMLAMSAFTTSAEADWFEFRTPALMDVATRGSFAPTRTATDALGTTDVATRAAVVRTRTASDSVGTSDAAARAPQTFARTASDVILGAPTVTDDFSADTIASGGWTNFGTDTPVISGGQLTAAGTGAAPRTLRWTAQGQSSAVRKMRVKYSITSGMPSSGNSSGTPAIWLDQNNYIRAYLQFFSSSDVRLSLAKVDGGASSLLVNGTPLTQATFTVAGVWNIELERNGDLVTVRFWAPALNPDVDTATATTTYTLTGADKTKFGAGVNCYWALATENKPQYWDDATLYGAVADTATRAATAPTRTATDALGTTDAATRTTARTRTATDALGTSDAAATTAGAFRSATDSLGTSDAATRAAVVRTRTATDALGTSDAAARTLALPRTAGDTLATSDAATRTATVRVRTAVDTLGTSDVAVRVVSRPRTASDALATSDAATRAATVRIRSGTDTLGTSDLAFVGSSPLRSAADALGTSDAATRAPTIRARSASDVLASSDAATRTATVRSRSASDTLGTSDVARSAPFRTASDALGTSDAATRTSLRTRTSTDTLGTSDAATRAAGAGARSAADVLGTSDLATRSATYVRFSADLLGSSDVAVVASAGFGRFASDTLGTSDQPGRVLVSYRFAADELGTTDTAVSVLTRFASDTLGTSDVATIVVAALVIGTVLVTDSPSALLSISDSAQLELALSSSALTIFDEPA